MLGGCDIGPLRRTFVNSASLETEKETLEGVPFICDIASGVAGKSGIGWLIGT
jgi:hypothetical protein